MKEILLLLSNLQKNGVVSVSDVKAKSFYLYKYFLNNETKLTKALYENYGIIILNEETGYATDKGLVAYIRYYFGNTVNLTELRKNHISAYIYLCNRGVEPFLLSHNFEIEYTYTIKEKDLIEILKDYADNEGNLVKPLTKKLNNTIFYLSRKNNMNIQEYLKSIGFNRKRWNN